MLICNILNEKIGSKEKHSLLVDQNGETDIKKIKKARDFVAEVLSLSRKYDLPVFIVTDGASGTNNNGCVAVRNARNNHIEFEKNNGFDPYHDWSK